VIVRKGVKDSILKGSVVPLLFDTWLRPSRCSIEGADIVATGQAGWYSPASVEDLVGAFGSIVDATGAVRFVTEFGPLELPEKVSRAAVAMGTAVFESRESVESILMRANKVARIRRVAASWADTRPAIKSNLGSILVDVWGLKIPMDPDPTAAAKELSTAKVKHVVGDFILNEMNNHLPRVWARAHISSRGEFESVLCFHDLHALIYRRLFDQLERGKLRLCQECESVFEYADPRQMYCSKRCGLNLAQRRYRERQRD
jgi:hypothetical protein